MNRAYLPIAVTVAVLAVLPLGTASNTTLNFLSFALIVALAAQGWNILGGYGGQFSFGHAAFFGTGAYGMALLQVRFGINPWLALPLATLLGGAVGAAIGALSFRAQLRGSYFALVTLAFAEVFRILANAWGFTGGAAGVLVPLRIDPANMQFADRASFYWLVLACVAAALVLTQAMARARFGAWLVAVRENEEAARALGVDSLAVKLRAITLSSSITALAGGLYAQKFLYIDAGIAYGAWISVEALLAPIIGGLGTVFGPLVGALVLLGLGEATKIALGHALGGSLPGADLVVFGVLLILCVAFAPRGLLGLGADLRRLLREARGMSALLDVRGVTMRFGGLVAVDNADLDVAPGSITGLIGPNGAGKTTLFTVIAGFQQPSAGTVRFAGEHVTHLPAHARAIRGIARTFQIVQPFAGLTVHENIAVGAYLRHARRDEALARAAAVGEAVGLGPLLHRPAGALTVAGRKRLELARALATEPRLLLLDEVLAGLNPSEIRDMLPVVRRIRDSGVTILMVEHVMQAVMSLCDTVHVIAQGRMIAHGTPSEVARDPRVVEAYLGHGAARRLAGGADA